MPEISIDSCIDVENARDVPLYPKGLPSSSEEIVSESSLAEANEISSSTPNVWQRGFGALTIGGVRHSILTLTSTAVGGGILSISYVMYLCGVGLGSLMLAIGALLAYLGTVILMQLSTEGGHESYAALFSHCAGRAGGPILDAMLFVYGNGACIGYMVFLGDFIPALVSLWPDAPAWVSGRPFAVLASALIMTPAVVQKDLAVLRFVTPVSIIALVYVTMVITAGAPQHYHEHEIVPAFGHLKVAVVDWSIFEAFSICVFAFNCHLNVVPVAGIFVRPTKTRIQKVSARVNVLQLVLYAVIGVAGYVSFLDQTPQDILIAYDAHNPLIIVARALLSVTMLVAVPMNMMSTVRSGLQLAHSFRGTPMLPSPTNGEIQTAEHVQSQWPRIVLALACLAFQAMVAIVVSGVADVLSLLGATIATAMMLIIPAYCIRVSSPRTKLNLAKQCFLLVFALMSFLSVPVKALRRSGVLQ